MTKMPIRSPQINKLQETACPKSGYTDSKYNFEIKKQTNKKQQQQQNTTIKSPIVSTQIKNIENKLPVLSAYQTFNLKTNLIQSPWSIYIFQIISYYRNMYSQFNMTTLSLILG